MRIWELFEGYEKAHGRYEIKRVNDKGKNEGRAATYKDPPTQALWDGHISGTGAGLGIIPLKANNCIRWGCIDIDTYPLDHAKLEKQIDQFQLPLVICRSKSGGAHCFLFFNEDVDAKDAIEAMTTWAAILGYGGAEVFPKQSQRYDEIQDIGNWLNMPYFYAERTTRYGIRDGEALSLAEFEQYAASKRISADELDNIKLPINPSGSELNEGIFEEGPPCLQILYSKGGLPDGTRNDGMFSVAVYLRKRFADDWETRLQEYNLAMCDPPLSLTDINTIVKSVGRKDYEYKCKKAPLAPYCQRRLCRRRMYGVGETAEGGHRPEVLDVKRYVADPVLWFLTIDGHRMMFTSPELTNQTFFKNKVLDVLGVVPRALPQDRWDKWLNDTIANCEVEHAPEDSLESGQFQIAFESYIMGMSKTNTREQLADNLSPYNTGQGEIWFKLQGLLAHMDRHGYKYKSTAFVTHMLKQDPINARHVEMSIKGKTRNIWIVKTPQSMVEDKDPDIKFGTTEF